MMIIKFTVTDDEVKAFFEGCGYTCRYVETGYWTNVSHSESRFVEIEVLHVKIAKNKTVKAEKLFKETIKAQLMGSDLDAKLAIKKAIKNVRNA